jgi:hypothetical protein
MHWRGGYDIIMDVFMKLNKLYLIFVTFVMISI